MAVTADSLQGELAARVEILSAVVQELCAAQSPPQTEFILRRLKERLTPAAATLFDSVADEAAAAELAAVLRSLSTGGR